MADLRDCFRFRSEAALAFRKLTRGSPGGQPTHRKSLCLGSLAASCLRIMKEDARDVHPAI
jgi:hypothetical protein